MSCLALHGTGPRNDREPTVTRHGSPRVLRCSAHGSPFGAIDDEEITQVDGVPVPVGVGYDETDVDAVLAETTPIPIVVVERGHVFWGRRAS